MLRKGGFLAKEKREGVGETVKYKEGDRRGNAWRIVEGHLNGAEELPLLYPVTTEIPKAHTAYRDAIADFYDVSAAAVVSYLDDGRDVAVLSEGDQSLNRPLLAVTKASSALGSEALTPLRDAIRKRFKVQLGYCDTQERVSGRLIRPLGLTAFESVWVLTAWCEMRSDFRNFRLDRIRDYEVTATRFPKEPGKEFQDYLKTL